MNPPEHPKAERAIDLLTAAQLGEIYRLSREKFDIQGTFKVVSLCREKLGCELIEISIETAKWIIASLSELPEHPNQIRLRTLPPRLPARAEGVIEMPPAPRDEAVWGVKL